MSLAQNNNLTHRRKRKLSNCQDCNESDDNNMVQCDECDKWSHYRCANVGPEVENNYWACHRCLVKCETKITIKTVPMLWITAENGEVWILWPSKLENRPVEFENAVKNLIKPKSDWHKIKCQVLMTNINTYKEAKASEKKISNVRCASKPKVNPKKPKTSEQHQPWQQVLKEVKDLRSSFQKLVVGQKSTKVVQHADPLKDADEEMYAELSETTDQIVENSEIGELAGAPQFGERDESLGRERADDCGEEVESTNSNVERAGHNNCGEEMYAELSGTTDQIVENSEIGELAGAPQFGERDESLGRERADDCGEEVESTNSNVERAGHNNCGEEMYAELSGTTDQIVENSEIGELAGASQFGERDGSLGSERADSGEQVENSKIGEQAALGIIEFEESDGYQLPITEKGHIVAFDDALEDKEVASKQNQSFQRLYAKDYKNMVRMAIKRIFADTFLKDYNFTGQRGKLALNEYGNVVNLIIDATHKKFPGIEKATILKYFMEHTKHAKERCNTKKTV